MEAGLRRLPHSDAALEACGVARVHLASADVEALDAARLHHLADDLQATIATIHGRVAATYFLPAPAAAGC